MHSVNLKERKKLIERSGHGQNTQGLADRPSAEVACALEVVEIWRISCKHSLFIFKEVFTEVLCFEVLPSFAQGKPSEMAGRKAIGAW